MFNTQGQIKLLLGTSTNVTSQIAIRGRQHPIYLTYPPFDNNKPLIDNFTVLYFLSTFKNTKYSFSQTKKIKTKKQIAKQIFTNFIIISRKQTELFKIFFQTSGNYFVIQVLHADDKIKYSKIYSKLHTKERIVYLFKNKIRQSLDPNLPIQVENNKGISEFSDFYNNQSVDKTKQNQITASLFYSVAPFDLKTIKRTQYKTLNPDNSLEGIFNNFGGTLFKFHPKESINLTEYPFEVFAYFSPYFEEIVESTQFEIATTIELDATFRVLSPYALCIPTVIFRNTGIPLGILISPSEKTSLYCMFFEALKKFDEVKENSEENSLFLKFIKKKYLTDEHKSFTKLSTIYGLEMYNCMVHLIRSIGANSLLGLLLKDMLFTFSGEEWSNNLSRFYHTFNILYEFSDKKESDIRFIKVSQVLGLDSYGNEVQVKKEYSPLYKRLEYNVPSTTNHVESMHKQLNTIIKGKRLSLQLRLAITIKYIIDRTFRTDISAHLNLKSHLKNLQKNAEKAISKNKNIKSYYMKSYCNCYKQIYYSELFWTTIPCIHTILKEDFDVKYYVNQMKNYDFNFSFKKDNLKVYDISTDLTFRKRKARNDNNADDDDQTPINMKIDEFNTNDPLTRIINHTESQLADILKSNNINFTVLALNLQSELLLDEEVSKIKKENIDRYFALFQVRLWFKILENRNIIV